MALVLAEELAKQSILTPNHVLLLRQYIGSKYPTQGPKSQAMVFANAIHQVLDRELVTFQDNLRQIIKSNLLNDLFSKEHFLLTAKDVFDSILNANALLVQGFNAVTMWLANRLNDVPEEMLIQALDNHLSDTQNKTAPLSDVFLGTVDVAHVNASGSPIHHSLDQTSSRPYGNVIKLPRISVSINRRLMSDLMSYLQLAAIAAVIGFVLWMFTSGAANYWLTRVSESVQNQIYSMTAFGKSANATPLATPGENTADNTAVIAVAPAETLNVSPLDIHYQPVNSLLLAEWLTRRESFLAKKSYIDAILIAAEDNDINPLVLIAIAGQEQGFVPVDHPQASKIANNPFNVFGSWQGYNTTISDSAHIAARTVNRLSKDCPSNVDPLLWVNRSYAEDQNWWRGVRDILTQLQSDIQKKD